MHVAALVGQFHRVRVSMAHLAWSRSWHSSTMAFINHGSDLAPAPWSNMQEHLPPAFRVQSSEPDTPAKARRALLSQETPPVNIGVGMLYVGDSTSAVQWAGQHVAYIINCADLNYDWHPWCLRVWLDVGHRDVFDDLDWPKRMMTAVMLVMSALMFGQKVLLHCRQGKHRSGAFCVLMLALLWECSVKAAL